MSGPAGIYCTFQGCKSRASSFVYAIQSKRFLKCVIIAAPARNDVSHHTPRTTAGQKSPILLAAHNFKARAWSNQVQGANDSIITFLLIPNEHCCYVTGTIGLRASTFIPSRYRPTSLPRARATVPLGLFLPHIVPNTASFQKLKNLGQIRETDKHQHDSKREA